MVMLTEPVRLLVVEVGVGVLVGGGVDVAVPGTGVRVKGKVGVEVTGAGVGTNEAL